MPVAAEVLERLTSHQQRVGLRVLAVQLLEQILVGKLRVEPAFAYMY